MSTPIFIFSYLFIGTHDMMGCKAKQTRLSEYFGVEDRFSIAKTDYIEKAALLALLHVLFWYKHRQILRFFALDLNVLYIPFRELAPVTYVAGQCGRNQTAWTKPDDRWEICGRP